MQDPVEKKGKGPMGFLLKCGLTILLLGLFLYRTDLARLLSHLKDIAFGTALLVVLLSLAGVFVNSVKWFLLLPQYPLLKLFGVNFIGLYYTLLLPGQMTGEVAKAYRLGRGKRDAEQIAASVLVDKITGVIGVFAMIAMGLFLSDRSLGTGMLISAFTGMAVCLAVLVLIRSQEVYRGLSALLTRLSRRPGRFSRLVAQVLRMIEAWHSYCRRSGLLLISAGIGFVYQIVPVFCILLLAREIGIEVEFADWCWVFGVVSLALFFPITVSGIGIREGTFVGILGWMGVAMEKSLALSFSIFAFQILLALIGGGIDLSMKDKEEETGFHQAREKG
ncbi:MAG: flippase-like domain-containing protein [Deltaproteobacteria bacterium]|nr:flippase-like domain-containing protein [Deltaproteobacteria bacterium]